MFDSPGEWSFLISHRTDTASEIPPCPAPWHCWMLYKHKKEDNPCLEELTDQRYRHTKGCGYNIQTTEYRIGMALSVTWILVSFLSSRFNWGWTKGGRFVCWSAWFMLCLGPCTWAWGSAVIEDVTTEGNRSGFIKNKSKLCHNTLPTHYSKPLNSLHVCCWRLPLLQKRRVHSWTYIVT